MAGSPADNRGRVTLPAKLRKAAKIEDEAIVFMGFDDYFEGWSKKNGEIEMRKMQAKVSF